MPKMADGFIDKTIVIKVKIKFLSVIKCNIVFSTPNLQCSSYRVVLHRVNQCYLNKALQPQRAVRPKWKGIKWANLVFALQCIYLSASLPLSYTVLDMNRKYMVSF